MEQLSGYDWDHIFAEYSKFSRNDIAEIISVIDGENDGPDWIGVFLLKDSKYGAVRAGCDYTGWG